MAANIGIFNNAAYKNALFDGNYLQPQKADISQTDSDKRNTQDAHYADC
jgi:hypothetical protein